MSGSNGVRDALLLFLGTMGFLLVGVADHDLWTPDEPRVAEIARETGMFLKHGIPTLGGVPFVEKPPLAFWSIWLCYAVTGQSTATVARIPSLWFALATAMFSLLLGRRLFSPRVGNVAFLLTLFCGGWIFCGHRATVDPLLACTVAGAMWTLDLGFHPRSPRERRGGWVGFYLFAALGFGAKGLVGIAFPFLGLIGLIGLERRWTEFLRWRHLAGAALVLSLIGLWIFALWREDPSGEFVSQFVVSNQLERFFPESTGYTGGHRKSSPFFYVGRLLAWFLPWALLLPHTLLDLWKKHHLRRVATPLALLCTGFLLLSVAGTKRSVYLLPIMAPLAVVVASSFARALSGESQERGTRAVLAILVAVLSMDAVGGPVARLALEGRPSGVSVVAAIAGIAVVAATFSSMRRRSWRPTFGVVVLLTTAAYAGATSSWVGFVDRRKSLQPLGEAIELHVPSVSRLVLFHPDETTRAVVPFYTGRFPEVAVGPAEVIAPLSVDEPVYIVTLYKRGIPVPGGLRAGALASVEQLLGQHAAFEKAWPHSDAPVLQVLAVLMGPRRSMVLACKPRKT